jgi:hypothetical protein
MFMVKNYEYIPFFPLDDAVDHSKDTISRNKRNAWIAKERATADVDGLTQGESAPIRLYRIEWKLSNQ